MLIRSFVDSSILFQAALANQIIFFGEFIYRLRLQAALLKAINTTCMYMYLQTSFTVSVISGVTVK